MPLPIKWTKRAEQSFAQIIDYIKKTILNYAENCSHYSGSGNSIVLTETQCAHELEKAQLLLQERDKEIEYLKQQISQLQDIVTLLKKVD